MSALVAGSPGRRPRASAPAEHHQHQQNSTTSTPLRTHPAPAPLQHTAVRPRRLAAEQLLNSGPGNPTPTYTTTSHPPPMSPTAVASDDVGTPNTNLLLSSRHLKRPLDDDIHRHHTRHIHNNLPYHTSAGQFRPPAQGNSSTTTTTTTSSSTTANTAFPGLPQRQPLSYPPNGPASSRQPQLSRPGQHPRPHAHRQPMPPHAAQRQSRPVHHRHPSRRTPYSQASSATPYKQGFAAPGCRELSLRPAPLMTKSAVAPPPSKRDNLNGTSMQPSSLAAPGVAPSVASTHGTNLRPSYLSSKLEDYVLDRVIGSGASSTVVRASPVADPTLVVALKAIAKKALSRRAQRYLAREIAIHRAISRHPNIVDLYEVFENSAGIYLVMELLRGGDLYSALRRERNGLGERVALSIIVQVLDALAYIHGMGVSHRDIKLENIVLVRKVNLHSEWCSTETTSVSPTRSDPKGASCAGGSVLDDIHVKLIDFGLACARDPESAASDRLTREKCGTLRYAAPEVFGESAYAPERADIWSVGVVLYSILAHRHPYSGNNGKDVVRMITSTELRFDTPAFSNVTSCTIALIRSLLSKDPEARPDASSALLEARRILLSLPVKPAAVNCQTTGSPSYRIHADPAVDSSPSHADARSVGSDVSQSICNTPGFLSSTGPESSGTPTRRELSPPTCQTPTQQGLAVGPALDALSSAVSGDGGKSQNTNSGRTGPHGSNSSTPFDLGYVVRGIFEVFNRGTSVATSKAAGGDTTVIDDSDSEDGTDLSSECGGDEANSSEVLSPAEAPHPP